MSMEVSSNHRDYRFENIFSDYDHLEKLQESRPVPRDEYISSEKSNSRPSGLYRMGQDENGNPKVLYDEPKKSGGADGKEQPKAQADSSKKDVEKCTMNTDKTDREIKKLKEQKQQLEQQVKAASGDEERVKDLKKKLSRVKSELSQKDNDTYRRQNAVIS
ncbi:MAG: hypothetical protein NC121_07625 [Blautia sp.]|nr:hypothetical protein [Blautia sp.]